MLLSLPAELVNCILCEWLRVADIGKLDSAYCVQKERPKLLETFRSPHFITDVLLPSNIQWAISRDVRAKSIGKDTFFDFQLLSQYLMMHADSCQDVRTSSRTPEQFITIIATHCRRLLSLTANRAGPEVGQLLQKNPNLQVFDFHSTGFDRDFDFSHIVLPNVHTLTACASELDDEEALAMYRMFPNVLKLSISTVGSRIMRLTTRITQLVPQLRTLNMQACFLSGAMFTEIVAMCPNIVHLNVRGNEGLQNVYEGVDDAAILSAASGLKLRSIAFTYHAGITSRSFEYLALHCSTTLQEVHVTHLVAQSRKSNFLNNTNTVSRESIEQLKHACRPNMKFAWHTTTHLDVTTYFRLPHSTSLTVMFPMTDETLRNIASRCWQLRELCVQPRHVLFTESGLRDFLLTCDQVHTICVYYKDKHAELSAVAARFPGLFSLQPRSEMFDCMKLLIV